MKHAKHFFMLLTGAIMLAIGLTACVSVNGGARAPSAGDIMAFGGYDWRVLEVKDGKALILSDRVIAVHMYDSESSVWETSDIRRYLNETFYDTFDDDEKSLIAEAKTENKDNQWFGAEGGNDTVDKIFLLSLDEAVTYLGDSGQLENRPDGVFYISDEHDAGRIALDEHDHPRWWMLRSPGIDGGDGTYVSPEGWIGVCNSPLISLNGWVRPALWLNVE